MTDELRIPGLNRWEDIDGIKDPERRAHARGLSEALSYVECYHAGVGDPEDPRSECAAILRSCLGARIANIVEEDRGK